MTRISTIHTLQQHSKNMGGNIFQNSFSYPSFFVDNIQLAFLRGGQTGSYYRQAKAEQLYCKVSFNSFAAPARKFSGLKVHTDTPANSIFDGPITSLLS